MEYRNVMVSTSTMVSTSILLKPLVVNFSDTLNLRICRLQTLL